MTEFIGVPTTFALGMLGEHLANCVAKPKTQACKNASFTLQFLGMCLAAGYFVPKFCNMSMPPVMKKLMPNYDPNASDATPSQPLAPQINPNNPQNIPQKRSMQNVNFASLSPTLYNTGMRV